MSEAVARWLNPERSLRGNFELIEPAGNGVISVNRLFIAMICYVVLGVLTWSTITDPKFRGGTLLILGLFAVKTLLRRKDVPPTNESGDAD